MTGPVSAERERLAVAVDPRERVLALYGSVAGAYTVQYPYYRGFCHVGRAFVWARWPKSSWSSSFVGDVLNGCGDTSVAPGPRVRIVGRGLQEWDAGRG